MKILLSFPTAYSGFYDVWDFFFLFASFSIRYAYFGQINALPFSLLAPHQIYGNPLYLTSASSSKWMHHLAWLRLLARLMSKTKQQVVKMITVFWQNCLRNLHIANGTLHLALNGSFKFSSKAQWLQLISIRTCREFMQELGWKRT